MKTTRTRLLPLLLVALAGVLGVRSAAPVWAAPPRPDVATEVQRDLVYARVGETDLHLDLYRPGRAEGRPPLLVWVHGGGWVHGAKAPCPIAWLTSAGYAVASVEYRLTDVAIFPAQIHDVEAAIRWLRANDRRLAIDARRIGVAGASAGGHLVSLLGTGAGVAALEGTEGDALGTSDRVQAVYDMFGPADIVDLGSKARPATPVALRAVSMLLGGDVSSKTELARLASPRTHVSKDDAPFLIVHGGKDPLVPLDESRRFDAALRAAGVESRLHVIEGAGHGGPGFRTADVLDEMRAFFDRHVRLAGAETPTGVAPGSAPQPTSRGAPESPPPAAEARARARVRTAEAPGPYETARANSALEDAARHKTLPLAVTFPKAAGPHPVIVFSHGAYGSKDAYRPLAEHWASHGYVVVQPTHEDSLSLGKPVRRLLGNPFRFWRSRVDDVRLVLDHLDLVAAGTAGLEGTLDASRIGVGGHSFGAHTAQLLAGATTTEGRGPRESHADARPKAFLLISPQGRGDLLDASSWQDVRRPLLVITGTNDTGRGGQPFVWRMDPFSLSPPGDKLLALVVGAWHGFGGITGKTPFPGSGPKDPAEVEAVEALSLLFFDAYVDGDASARAALATPPLAGVFGDLVRFASRPEPDATRPGGTR